MLLQLDNLLGQLYNTIISSITTNKEKFVDGELNLYESFTQVI
jgi:hypothetical protein